MKTWELGRLSGPGDGQPGMGQMVAGWGGEGVKGAAGGLEKGVEELPEDLQMKEDL